MGFSLELGRFRLGWHNTGNNRFVKTPTPWRILNSNLTGKQEQYVTESMTELEIYATTPEVWVVFNRFASMFSGGVYVHKRKDGTPQGRVIEDSPLVDFLNKPNPVQTGKEFMVESALHYLVFGNRLTYPMFGSSLSTVPTVMNNLPPQHVKVVTTGKRWDQSTIEGIVEKYVLDKYGTTDKRTFLPGEIMHHKNVDPDNPVLGVSPLTALHMPVSNIRAAYGFRNVNLTKKGALGFITGTGSDALGALPIGSADRKAIEDQYTKETHGIFDEQSPIAMLRGDAKFVATNYPLKDSMVFEEISEDMKKIIDAVQLNDNIFSKEKSKVQANLNEGLRMGYQDAIIPFAEAYCENLAAGLRLPSDEWLEIDFSHLPCMQEDNVKTSQVAERNARAINTLVQAGYTKEEAAEVVYGSKA